MFFKKPIIHRNLSEADNLASFKATGDLEVLGKIYEPYMDMVFAVCYKYLRNSEESKDAVMQIFEQLIIKLRNHKVDNFRSWLHSLARNHCLMQIRATGSAQFENSDSFFMENRIELHQDSEHDFEIDEKLNGLEKCMEKLNIEQKTSVQLFYIEEKCYQEVAEITGFELSKVKSYIQNGKRNLKMCLENK